MSVTQVKTVIKLFTHDIWSYNRIMVAAAGNRNLILLDNEADRS